MRERMRGKHLTMKQRCEVINVHKETGMGIRDLARKFSVGKTQIQRSFKRKKKTKQQSTILPSNQEKLQKEKVHMMT